MSLLKLILENRVRLTPKEKTQVGKAKILKYLENSKIKYAVHEQPVLRIHDNLKDAIKSYWGIKNYFS